ncbi:sulfur carrier protein ThiS [Rhodobacteraceae bacterium 2CG4]|uniref:Sulfur carrier protein ThiS n=1 Tax=Halovulum marinum TaxID=2662447 RepID=A0A6L5YWM7_9RHOB|nr:sulfur carrier protein ThiS [Halovulum marinum]MSU88793.1 sulfur carrier protein ThiS [Halovulum marinum]
MKIKLNGEPTEVSAAALPEVLAELGYGDAKIATALNETFVPVAARVGITLSEGDRLEVVTPRQGG